MLYIPLFYFFVFSHYLLSDGVTRNHSPTQNRPKGRNDQIPVSAAKSRFSGRAPPKANTRAKGVTVSRTGLITRGGCNRKLRRVSVSSKASAGCGSVSWRAESGNVPRASIRNALTNAGISLVSIPSSKDEDVAPLVLLSLSLSLSLSFSFSRVFAALHTLHEAE